MAAQFLLGWICPPGRMELTELLDRELRLRLMYLSRAEFQLCSGPRHPVGTPKLVQPTSTYGISLSSLSGQIKHCAVGLLPVLFRSFPCKITAKKPILPRPRQRDLTPRFPFGSLDTLLLDGFVERELRTSNELASPGS